MTDFAEITNLVISLLPIIIIILVFRWIIMMFRDMDILETSDWKRSILSFGAKKKTGLDLPRSVFYFKKVYRIECDKCGASNTSRDEKCVHCSVPLDIGEILKQQVEYEIDDDEYTTSEELKAEILED